MTEPDAYILGDRPHTNRQPEVFSGRRSIAHTWVEVPSADGPAAAWVYSDRDSYSCGEIVKLFISSNVRKISLRFYRDGAERALVREIRGVDAEFQSAPPDAYMNGCAWKESIEWTTVRELKSGGYLIEVRVEGDDDGPPIGHHLVFLRASGNKDKTIVLVAATATWRAYNDFGGANHYRGINPDYFLGASPIVSSRRPWGRGQIWLPRDAPCFSSPDRPRQPRPPRYESFEYAYANGFARNYGCAGWASYEQLFVDWAERIGYSVDARTNSTIARRH